MAQLPSDMRIGENGMCGQVHCVGLDSSDGWLGFFATDSKINQSNNYRQITVAKIVIKHLSHILIMHLLGKSKESIKENHAHLFFLHITRQA